MQDQDPDDLLFQSDVLSLNAFLSSVDWGDDSASFDQMNSDSLLASDNEQRKEHEVGDLQVGDHTTTMTMRETLRSSNYLDQATQLFGGSLHDVLHEANDFHPMDNTVAFRPIDDGVACQPPIALRPLCCIECGNREPDTGSQIYAATTKPIWPAGEILPREEMRGIIAYLKGSTYVRQQQYSVGKQARAIFAGWKERDNKHNGKFGSLTFLESTADRAWPQPLSKEEGMQFVEWCLSNDCFECSTRTFRTVAREAMSLSPSVLGEVHQRSDSAICFDERANNNSLHGFQSHRLSRVPCVVNQFTYQGVGGQPSWQYDGENVQVRALTTGPAGMSHNPSHARTSAHVANQQHWFQPIQQNENFHIDNTNASPNDSFVADSEIDFNRMNDDDSCAGVDSAWDCDDCGTDWIPDDMECEILKSFLESEPTTPKAAATASLADRQSYGNRAFNGSNFHEHCVCVVATASVSNEDDGVANNAFRSLIFLMKRDPDFQGYSSDEKARAVYKGWKLWDIRHCCRFGPLIFRETVAVGGWRQLSYDEGKQFVKWCLNNDSFEHAARSFRTVAHGPVG